MGLAPPAIVRDATDSLLRRPGHAAAMARRLHRRRRPVRLQPHHRAVRLMEDMVRSRNMKPGSAQALSEALADRGFVKKRNNAGQQGFSNLTIKG